MNSHKHARLTPKGRALLVSRVLEGGWSVGAASYAGGVSKRTGFKWLARFRAEGDAGLLDRSSRPRRSPRALTPQDQAELEALRRRRWPAVAHAKRPDRTAIDTSHDIDAAGGARHPRSTSWMGRRGPSI